jgi:plastocyanin
MGQSEGRPTDFRTPSSNLRTALAWIDPKRAKESKMVASTLRRGAVVALAAATVFAFPGTSVGETRRVRAEGSLGNFRWDPSFRHIVRGDRIVWKNTTDYAHTVKSYGGNWSFNRDLPVDGRVRKRFRRRGTFRYRCRIHSTLNDGECTGQMCGVIHVTRN